jgi:hypothetical protein
VLVALVGCAFGRPQHHGHGHRPRPHGGGFAPGAGFGGGRPIGGGGLLGQQGGKNIIRFLETISIVFRYTNQYKQHLNKIKHFYTRFRRSQCCWNR